MSSFELLAEDGLCTLTLKGDNKGSIQNNFLRQILAQQTESSFSNWPLSVQLAVITRAWKGASCNQEQHALRCSCKLARDITTDLIHGADLSISSPVYEEGAIRTLASFPFLASLTSVTLGRYEIRDAEAISTEKQLKFKIKIHSGILFAPAGANGQHITLKAWE